jgi:hypothetical protein
VLAGLLAPECIDTTRCLVGSWGRHPAREIRRRVASRYQNDRAALGIPQIEQAMILYLNDGAARRLSELAGQMLTTVTNPE